MSNSELSEITGIVKQTALSVSAISEQMGLITSEMKHLKQEIFDIKARQDRTDNRLSNYEDRLRVTRHQSQNIRNSIHMKAADLLDIDYDKDGVIISETALYNDKYYRSGFISRCYVDARKHSKLGTPYTETLQRDYEEVLDFISKWNPPTGIEGYKAYLDARRKR